MYLLYDINRTFDTWLIAGEWIVAVGIPSCVDCIDPRGVGRVVHPRRVGRGDGVDGAAGRVAHRWVGRGGGVDREQGWRWGKITEGRGSYKNRYCSLQYLMKECFLGVCPSCCECDQQVSLEWILSNLFLSTLAIKCIPSDIVTAIFRRAFWNAPLSVFLFRRAIQNILLK